MSNFKSAVPTVVQPEVVRPDDLYVREYAQGVWIPLLQNLFGGLLGAGGLVGLVTWRAGLTVDEALLIGGVVGGIAFCAATMIRAFRDEVRLLMTAYGERQDRATRLAQAAEIAQLREEMKLLRSQGTISSKFHALMTTERLLGDYYERHLDISRAETMKRGYTRAQWDAAMRLCRAAQVVSEKGNVLVPTFAESWARVLHSQSAGMGSFAVTEAGDVVRTK